MIKKFFYCNNNYCSPIHCVCITSFSQLFSTTSMTTYSFHTKTPKTSQIFKIGNRIIKFNFSLYSVLSYYFKCTNFQPLQQPLQKMLAQGNQQSILCITLAIFVNIYSMKI